MKESLKKTESEKDNMVKKTTFNLTRFFGLLLMILGAFSFLTSVSPSNIINQIPLGKGIVEFLIKNRLTFFLSSYVIFFIGLLLYLGMKKIEKFFK